MPSQGQVLPPAEGQVVTPYELARNSARAYKGWLTAKLKACDNAIEAADVTPSAFALENAKKAFKASEDQLEKLEEALRLALSLAPEADREDLEGEMLAQTDKVGARRSALCILLEARDRQEAGNAGAGAGPPPPAAPTAPIIVGVNSELKPGVLTLEYSPREYRRWTEQLYAFFNSNDWVEKLPAKQQYEYVRQLIDIDLETRISQNLDNTVQVFNKDGLAKAGGPVDLISREFLIQYPLNARRKEYFAYIRQQGQTYSSFIAGLMQLG